MLRTELWLHVLAAASLKSRPRVESNVLAVFDDLVRIIRHRDTCSQPSSPSIVGDSAPASEKGWVEGAQLSGVEPYRVSLPAQDLHHDIRNYFEHDFTYLE